MSVLNYGVLYRGLNRWYDMGKKFILRERSPFNSVRMTTISTVRGFLTVTDLNDFNGLIQT